MSIFLKFSGKCKAFILDQNLQNELNNYFSQLKVNPDLLFFTYQGKCLSDFDRLQKDSTINVAISLRGGKGGFGAKLKNQGGKKIKPNDNMFSRDASGRRIQYQNMQRDYTQFVKKKIQQDKKVNHQRQQFKIMQDTMKQGQSFMKLDKQYNQQLQKTQSKLSQSIKIGKLRVIQKMKKQQEKQIQRENKQSQKYQRLQLQQVKQQNPVKEQQHKQKSKYQQNQDSQIQKLSQSIKKIKRQSQITYINKSIQKPITNQPISAKDKLKSLFKK